MTEFKTDPIFEALKTPLGLVDDPERRRQLEAYIEAARPPLERAVTELLSQVVDVVNTGTGARYEVTLGYRQGALDLDVRAREASEASEEPWAFVEGDVEKITLRIPAELKELAIDAANQASLSANSWFVRMLARAVRGSDAQEQPKERRRGRRARDGGDWDSTQRGQRLSGWVGPEE
jgi:predicted HicB family RNase H-like nuclease